MVSGLALSTMWGIGQFAGLAEFFTAGARLGFDRFELNHGVDSAMMAGLAFDGLITSVHEPCPADVSLSELRRRNWLVSAVDQECRRRGVQAVEHSIDLAARLGATAVIVHPGKVDVDPELEWTLLDLYRAGRQGEPDYVSARERLVAARATQAPDNMAAVRRSLVELAEHAARLGVRLGLENRYHYHEIPLPDELDELLNLGLGDTVGHWHDTGHGLVLENLGLGTHEEWLRRFAGRMVGVHLHDVIGVNDHLAAGVGQIDWDMVARYLPRGLLRTCEFRSTTPAAQVAAGVRWLADRGI